MWWFNSLSYLCGYEQVAAGTVNQLRIDGGLTSTCPQWVNRTSEQTSALDDRREDGSGKFDRRTVLPLFVDADFDTL